MMESTSTYRAVQAVAPGRLELVRKPIRAPGPGEVRIRVEACGVCHSDSGTVEALFPIDWPRVPGHEAVGRIDALGPHVGGWAAGQRVGVGFLGGSCGHCDYCRGGDLVNCRNQEFTGIHRDGGYAEMLIARASGLMSIPDDLSSVNAAPLLCAGLTTFSALRLRSPVISSPWWASEALATSVCSMRVTWVSRSSPSPAVRRRRTWRRSSARITISIARPATPPKPYKPWAVRRQFWSRHPVARRSRR